MRITKNQIISYLVDCLGYSESQDLDGLNYSELMALVDDKQLLINYYK
jgi:hypothetical protein